MGEKSGNTKRIISDSMNIRDKGSMEQRAACLMRGCLVGCGGACGVALGPLSFVDPDAYGIRAEVQLQAAPTSSF